MVKHIVLWRLHEEADGRTRDENAALAKEQLEGLNGRIPGLLHLEVGRDFLGSPASYDLVLYAELESREALDVYQHHPEHVAVKHLMAAITDERAVVDYEL
jgi:hypothetical protein